MDFTRHYDISPSNSDNDLLPGDLRLVGTINNPEKESIWVHKLVIWEFCPLVKKLVIYGKGDQSINVDLPHDHLTIILRYLYGFNDRINMEEILEIATSANYLGATSFIEQKCRSIFTEVLAFKQEGYLTPIVDQDQEEIVKSLLRSDSHETTLIIGSLCRDGRMLDLFVEAAAKVFSSNLLKISIDIANILVASIDGRIHQNQLRFMRDYQSTCKCELKWSGIPSTFQSYSDWVYCRNKFPMEKRVVGLLDDMFKDEPRERALVGNCVQLRYCSVYTLIHPDTPDNKVTNGMFPETDIIFYDGY